MKKIMMIGSALFVLSSSAVFATQARLLALGMKETDNDGMYYIQDSRNIFLNVANVNNYSDMLVTEYGAAGTPLNAGQTASVNGSTAPKAQGGVFQKYGSLVYGAYLGNESNTSSFLRVAGTSDITSNRMLQTTDNQLDLFVGGESSVKWGANVIYANGKDEAIKSKNNALSTRFGVIASGWDANLSVSLASKSEAESTTGIQAFKGKLGLQLGGSYNVGAGKVFGTFKTFSWDQLNTGAATVNGDFSSYFIGYGREMAVNNGDKIFASLTAKKTDVNVKFTNKGEVRNLIVPVTLGYEARATEWLIVRGSVIQNLYGQQDNKNIVTAGAVTSNLNTTAQGLVAGTYGGNGKKTLANSTEVNAGASLEFGKLSIDGLIGATGSTGINGSKAGILSASNLLTTVGATYKF